VAGTPSNTEQKGEIQMDKMKSFFASDTYTVERQGYTIHLSRDIAYENEAVVEDMDGNQVHVDMSDYDYEDFDGFLDAVIEEYMRQ
jgi:hypothetical protein